MNSGEADMKKKKRVYVTARDRRILEFVDLYRTATAGLLAIALFGGAAQEDAASRVLRKLTRRGYLRCVKMAHGRSYVVMTRRGCRAIGAPDRTPRPLTEQSLPVVLAIWCFCVRGGLARMTDRELSSRFPDLWRTGLKSS